MKSKRLWWMAVVVLTLTLVGQYALYRSQGSPVGGHASWDFRPHTTQEVFARAQQVVTAHVDAVEEGKPLTKAMPGEPGGQDVIPTQRIRATVRSVDKGAASPGQQIVIFRTGGQIGTFPQAPAQTQDLNEHLGTIRQAAPKTGKPAADAKVTAPQQVQAQPLPGQPADAGVAEFLVEDDPPYQAGQDVYLALEAGPDNTMRPVGPDGRFLVGSDGKLHTVTQTAVAQSFEGIDVAMASAAAQGRAQIPTLTGGQKRVTTGGVPGMPTTGMPGQDLLPLAIAAIALLALGVGIVMRRRRA
jgi:hypothetical protein